MTDRATTDPSTADPTPAAPVAAQGRPLTLRGIRKRYGATVALDDIDLDVAAGELVALLGPSGSGKTTLLRVIAGLLEPDAGTLRFGDVDATRLSLRERNVGFVFQHYALFRHMTVAENVAFGLRSRPRRTRPARPAIAAKVAELLALVQLPEHGGRRPDQLSGGQKQRIALARALAIDPTVLLLDEPFGALDAKVRVELRRWLRGLHERTGQTTLFVTHDQDEALELADRIVVLRDGAIEQVGTPREVYESPATPFVFGFVGRGGALSGRVEGGAFVADGQAFALPVGDAASGAATVHVRPHQLRLAHDPGDGWQATVAAVHRRADRYSLELAFAGQPDRIEIDLADDGASPPAADSAVTVRPLRHRIFPAADR